MMIYPAIPRPDIKLQWHNVQERGWLNVHGSFQSPMMDFRIISDGCNQVHRRHDLPIWPYLHFTVISAKMDQVICFQVGLKSYLAMLDGTRQWLIFPDAIIDEQRQQWTSLLVQWPQFTRYDPCTPLSFGYDFPYHTLPKVTQYHISLFDPFIKWTSDEAYYLGLG